MFYFILYFRAYLFLFRYLQLSIIACHYCHS